MVKVKMFDEDHESDLEEAINEFLETIPHNKVRDIKYQLHVFECEEDGQEFCFSAMLIYETD